MSENTYSIICDARRGHAMDIQVLALVDRGRCKHLWWTSDNVSFILRYKKFEAAKFACGRLRRNNPRVVNYEEAVYYITEQEKNLMHHEAEAQSEMGWDAHKN